MIAMVIVILIASLMLIGIGSAFFRGAGARATARPAAAASRLVGRAASGGIPMADCDYREGDVDSVDTWTAIADREGSASQGIDVGGKGRKFLTSITISAADIMTVGTGVLTGCIAIKFSGTGMAKGGNYKFLGPAQTVQVTTSENLAAVSIPSVVYPTDIEMKDGKLDIEAIMTGDDIGTVTVNVTCSFADFGTPGGLKDGDVREGNATAVNTLTGQTVLGPYSIGTFKVPSSKDIDRLISVGVMQVADPPTTSATNQFSATFKLSGTGFNEGGTRRFGADGLAYGGDTAGSCMTAHGPNFYPVDIPVKDGEIEAQFSMLGTDGGGTMGMTFLGYA